MNDNLYIFIFSYRRKADSSKNIRIKLALLLVRQQIAILSIA
jgi:hypothetical protein